MDLSTLFCGIIVAVVIVVAGWLVNVLVFQPMRVVHELRRQGVPGPAFRPLLGQMPEMRALGNRRKADPAFAAISSPMPYCHEMLQRYGPLVSFTFGPLPALLAVDPAIIRAIYISHNMEFEKPWMMRKLFPLLGDGLLTSNKETWASHRRLVNPAFKPGEIMRLYPTILRCTTASVLKLAELVQREGGGGKGKVVQMDRWVAALMLQLLGHAVFGADLGSNRTDSHSEAGSQQQQQQQADETEAERLVNAYAEWFESTRFSFSLLDVLPGSSFLPLPHILRRRRSEAIVRSCALKLIEARREKRRTQRQREGRVDEGSATSGEEQREGVREHINNSPMDLLELMLSATEGEGGVPIGEDDREGKEGEEVAVGEARVASEQKQQVDESESSEACDAVGDVRRGRGEGVKEGDKGKAGSTQLQAEARMRGTLGAGARRGVISRLEEDRKHHKARQLTAGKLSNEQLIDQCMTFLTAGHETTSIAISWTLMTLAQYPDWQRRVREEVREVMRETEGRQGDDVVSESSGGGSMVREDSHSSDTESDASTACSHQDRVEQDSDCMSEGSSEHSDSMEGASMPGGHGDTNGLKEEAGRHHNSSGDCTARAQQGMKAGIINTSGFSLESINRLKLLPMVMNESMRLFSPVYFVARYNPKPVRVSPSLVVPAGVHVAMPIGLLHRRKDLWGEDAEVFRPERFAGEGVPPGAFVPFTLGPRFCIGQNLALAEAKTILALLLLHFEVELAPSFRLHPELGFNTRNKNGIPILLKAIGQDVGSIGQL